MADASIAPLDRIPAETRVLIFELVLCCDVPVVATNGKRVNNTALLVALVNDDKYIEAYEAFYKSNTFRLDYVNQLGDIMAFSTPKYGPVSYITHLEWPYLGKTNFTGTDDINRIVHFSSRLPKLKSLVICSETHLFPPCDLYDHVKKVDKELARRLVCVGVGHFTFQHTGGMTVHLKRRSLVRAWEAMKMSRRRTFREVVEAIAPGCETMDDGRLAEMMNVLFETTPLLPEWAVCFDEYRKWQVSGIPPTSRIGAQVLGTFNRYYSTISPADRVYERMAEGISFRDLDMGEIDVDLLEQIDWLLLANEGLTLYLEPYSMW
ncbi:hypothetical protein LTR15_012719 [Elasticomyces elasticus]|nr:hypothetical protein LTR15_012719 [Elasticomyces elasticus]